MSKCKFDTPAIVWALFEDVYYPAVTIPIAWWPTCTISLQKTHNMIKNPRTEVIVVFLDNPATLIKDISDLQIFDPLNKKFKSLQKNLNDDAAIENVMSLYNGVNFTVLENGKYLAKWKIFSCYFDTLIDFLNNEDISFSENIPIKKFCGQGHALRKSGNRGRRKSYTPESIGILDTANTINAYTSNKITTDTTITINTDTSITINTDTSNTCKSSVETKEDIENLKKEYGNRDKQSGFQTPPFEVIPSSKLIQFDCAIDSTRPYVVWCEYFNKWWSAVTIPKRFTENRLSLQKTQHLIKNEESEILIMFLDKPSFLVSQMEDLKIFNPNDAFFKKVSRSIPKLFEKDYIKNALRLLKKENFTSCNGKLLVKWKEWNLLINELLPELHTVTNLDSITVAHNGNEDISDSVHSAFYEKKNLEIENHFSSTKDCDPTTLEKREEFDKLIIAGDESWEVLSELDELEDGSSMPTAFALKNEVAVNADPIKDSTCYDKINVRKILEVEVSDFNSQYLLNNSKRRKEE